MANSKYATVREVNGVCYLFKKVVERAHMPSRLWEKIKLKGNLEQVTATINKHLEFMPEFFKVKCNSRYQRIQEYLKRAIKLQNDPNQPILSVKKSKVVRRETKREARAHQVALIDNAIEKELLLRLQNGVYGEIYNLPEKIFNDVLEKHGKMAELEESGDEAVEYVENQEDESEEIEESEVEWEEDLAESEIEDLEDFLAPPNKKPKGQHVEIEYEVEPERQIN